MDDRELLRKNYEDACNAYLRAFCQKHGYDEDDAVNSWAAGDVGGIASVGDEFVNMDTIIADIDMQAPETAFGEWYDYCLRLHMISEDITTPNYRNWLRGCPRKTVEEFAALEDAHLWVEYAKDNFKRKSTNSMAKIKELSNVFLSKRHVAILGVASGVLHGTTLILGTPG